MERRLHYACRMHARYALLAAVVAASFVGCHKRNSSSVDGRRAEAARLKKAADESARILAGSADEETGGGIKQQGSGSGGGMNRWKDVTVYVDGRPVGVVDFGELPIGLKPTWVEEEHSIEFDYGYKGPR